MTMACAVGASSNSGDSRATMNTPAVTMVAAWISADTGVGPSMASGSHTCSGNCALLPTAPMNTRITAVVNSEPPMNPDWAASEMSENAVEPVVAQKMMMPTNSAASPILVTTKALTAASRAEGFSNHSGYAVIYGVWTIGDTGNAFYNCLDVNIENDAAAPTAAEESPVETSPPTTTSASNSTTAAPTTMATSIAAASNSTTAASTTMATSTTVLLGTAVSGTAVYGTAVSGTAAATGSLSTATGIVENVGYNASSNSTILTLHDRRVRRAFFA